MDVFSKVVVELGVFPSASNTMAAAMNLQLERKIHRVALPTNQIHQCHQVHNIWWEMYLKLQLKLIREIKEILHLSPSSFICVVCMSYSTAKAGFDDLYKSVSTEETRLALVDLYSTTQHNVYYDKYGLYVATVLNEPVIIGAVLPTYPKSVRDCFISYQQEHQVEIHEIIEQFIRTDKVSTAVIFNPLTGQISPPEPPVVKSKHLE